ncbi:MAG: hypothetical protein JO368_08790, partial [Acidimicrobiales bacterium]|nr:hypothetical protein [Acidimicrobiales bacterium]
MTAGDGPERAPSGLAARVADGLARTRHRVSEAGADPAAVTIVAVTKGFGTEAVEAALAVGLTDLGENYAA